MGWRDVRLHLAGRGRERRLRSRVVVSDRGLGPSSWIAVAQPRVTAHPALTEVVAGRPDYLDWATSFMHRA
ncbi:hypothetical protein HBB16_08090 [Pseudonocardia sp. MCCB 268]|nr:hypothetical protein [Pseudonocardia cytotoxica]